MYTMYTFFSDYFFSLANTMKDRRSSTYMSRSLTNTMINLGIQGACDKAMYQVSAVLSGTKCRISLWGTRN